MAPDDENRGALFLAGENLSLARRIHGELRYRSPQQIKQEKRRLQITCQDIKTRLETVDSKLRQLSPPTRTVGL